MLNNTTTYNIQNYFFAFFMALMASYFLPSEAFAQVNTVTSGSNPDAITATLCTVVKSLTGPMGKAISTIAIVVLGIGLFVGKLQWPVAIATAIGIGLIFGASNLVNWLGGSAAAGASGCTNIAFILDASSYLA